MIVILLAVVDVDTIEDMNALAIVLADIAIFAETVTVAVWVAIVVVIESLGVCALLRKKKARYLVEDLLLEDGSIELQNLPVI